LVVTNIAGDAIAGVPIDVTIEGVLGSELDRDDAQIVDTQQCKLRSQREPVLCGFTRKKDQYAYRAIARIADERGRENAAQLYVPGGSPDDKDLAVVPDRKSYHPGDVAKLEVRSKVVPAVAVVTFARQGIITQKRVELTSPTAIVELPIDKAYLQNVHV